jgi:hypothetical protein
MGICDGLWAHRKVAEKIRLKAKTPRLAPGVNCLNGNQTMGLVKSSSRKLLRPLL